MEEDASPDLPQAPETRARLPWQTHNLPWVGVVVAFAGVGAFILYGAGGPFLSWLYNIIAARLTPQGIVQEPYRADPLLTGVPFAVLGALAGGWLGGAVYRVFEKLVGRWDKMDAGDKVTLFFGVFIGLFGAIPFVVLVQALQIPETYRILLISAVILFFTAISIYALQSISEVLPWNRGRVRARRSGLKLLDTNVIIDGRVYDVVKTGFLEGRLYVPGFVLDELQYIADSHDALRRQRGRRGLDVLRHLQSDFPMEVRVHDKLIADPKLPVDQKLVRLAKALGADIVTNDWNLNQVAKLESVKVLNINDLALALRTNVLPAESFEVTVVREGNQQGQGVGYLEDGTMVVVEQGRAYLGETIPVVVTQVIQTERGKMVFADVSHGEDALEPIARRRPSPGRRPL